MKNLLLTIFLLVATNIFSQTVYHSLNTYKKKNEFEKIEIKREIIISDSEIKISSFVGGTETLNLKVNDVKEKEYNMQGIMKWYYCTRTDMDALSGKYTEYIIIIRKDNPSFITACQKVDEVTFLKTDFWL